jgi:ABC-type phosphate transport system substrate-binding protein
MGVLLHADTNPNPACLPQVPIAINAVGIYANLPGRSNTSSSVNTSTSISTSPLRLDGCTLARIFSGQISSWDEPAIKELNPGVRWVMVSGRSTAAECGGLQPYTSA